MKEIWKDIQGYEDSYQISNLGRIKGKGRYAAIGGGKERFIAERILKPVVCTNGYLEAQLVKHGKRETYLLHRLVAAHFIDNPNNYPEVNHKDENPKNCKVDNLEWCTSKYNANYGTRNERVREKNKGQQRAVVKIDLDGNIVERFDCIGDASRKTGGDVSQIIRVCKGEQETCGGYIWKYASEVCDNKQADKPVMTNYLWRLKRENLNNAFLAENIKRLRQEQEINQTELANMVGIKQNTMSGIESGRRLPSYSVASKIAAALGVTFEDLTGL